MKMKNKSKRRSSATTRVICTGVALGLIATSTAVAQPVKPFVDGIKLDWKNRAVIIDATVVLREGPLELVACAPQTREHESILVVDAAPTHIFQAMGLLGFKSGSPVGWDEAQQKLIPPTGQPLTITVSFDPALTPKGKPKGKTGEKTNKPDRVPSPKPVQDHQTDDKNQENRKKKVTEESRPQQTEATPKTKAQAKLRSMPIERWLQTADGKPIDKINWVFAGSRLLEDKQLAAEADGTIICVVDFESALIAVGNLHTASNDALWLAANPKLIPPRGTACQLIIQAK